MLAILIWCEARLYGMTCLYTGVSLALYRRDYTPFLNVYFLGTLCAFIYNIYNIYYYILFFIFIISLSIYLFIYVIIPLQFFYYYYFVFVLLSLFLLL